MARQERPQLSETETKSLTNASQQPKVLRWLCFLQWMRFLTHVLINATFAQTCGWNSWNRTPRAPCKTFHWHPLTISFGSMLTIQSRHDGAQRHAPPLILYLWISLISLISVVISILIFQFLQQDWKILETGLEHFRCRLIELRLKSKHIWTSLDVWRTTVTHSRAMLAEPAYIQLTSSLHVWCLPARTKHHCSPFQPPLEGLPEIEHEAITGHPWPANQQLFNPTTNLTNINKPQPICQTRGTQPFELALFLKHARHERFRAFPLIY
jgi:hypothetical protein